MKNKYIILFLILCGCTPAEKKETSTSSGVEPVVLDAAAFKEKLSLDSAVVLLDVRTPEEVAEGIIPGASNIDFNSPDFGSRISGLDKEKTYLVYCKGGARSAKAVDLMKEAGFKKFHNLDGGYNAWVENGYETAKP